MLKLGGKRLWYNMGRRRGRQTSREGGERKRDAEYPDSGIFGKRELSMKGSELPRAVVERGNALLVLARAVRCEVAQA